MHLFLLGNASLPQNHNSFAPYHFFIIKTCACRYLFKIGDALCNTTIWNRFGICKRIKKIERMSVKFIIAQYWILYAKERRNIRRKKLWQRFHAPSCRFQKNEFTSAARNIVAAIMQLHYGTKYIPKHVCPMKQLQLRRERCLRQYMPILRMRIRTGKTRRQNGFSPIRILFRISADYASLWNTGAAALYRI